MENVFYVLLKRSLSTLDFPGGLVAKTPSSQYTGPRFDSWSGNWISHAATKSLHATAKVKNFMSCN